MDGTREGSRGGANVNEPESTPPNRFKLIKRANERTKRVRGHWDKPSEGSNGRFRWILAACLAPVAAWAMVSVLAGGKFANVLTPAHLVILVIALIVLGFFLWDSSDASRVRTWRTSWRSSRFRLACLRLFARDEPIRCPYCRDTVEDDSAPCRGCDATLHTACRLELGGCSTLGCAESKAAQGEAFDGKAASAKSKA